MIDPVHLTANHIPLPFPDTVDALCGAVAIPKAKIANHFTSCVVCAQRGHATGRLFYCMAVEVVDQPEQSDA